MPRVYQPSTQKNYKKYDSDILKKAVEELHTSSKSIMKIANKYGIHKSVLFRHSKKKMKKQGGPTALSAETELILIENLNICAKWGYPMETSDLKHMVKSYLDNLGINHRKFKDNLPGHDYINNFLNRHKNKISNKITNNIKNVHSEISPDIVNIFFNDLKDILNGVSAGNIISFNEFFFNIDQHNYKSVIRRVKKYSNENDTVRKTSLSMYLAGTPKGILLPPLVTYKNNKICKNWIITKQENTQITSKTDEFIIFESWINNIVLPYFKNKDGRKLLIGDHKFSYLSTNIIEMCKNNDIDFIFIPPKSSHILLPLEDSFNEFLEMTWSLVYINFKMCHKLVGEIPLDYIERLVETFYLTLNSSSSLYIKTGFQETGLHPLDVNVALGKLSKIQNNNDLRKDQVNDKTNPRRLRKNKDLINTESIPKKTRKSDSNIEQPNSLKMTKSKYYHNLLTKASDNQLTIDKNKITKTYVKKAVKRTPTNEEIVDNNDERSKYVLFEDLDIESMSIVWADDMPTSLDVKQKFEPDNTLSYEIIAIDSPS